MVQLENEHGSRYLSRLCIHRRTPSLHYVVVSWRYNMYLGISGVKREVRSIGIQLDPALIR